MVDGLMAVNYAIKRRFAMDPALILFAIEAGVKLGQKFYEVMVDANAERPLYLPFGDLFGSIQFNEANYFFRHDANGKKMFKKGGIFAGLQTDKEITDAYHYVLAVMQQCGSTSVTDNVYKVIDYRYNINQKINEILPDEDQMSKQDFKDLPFEQLKKGKGHAPPALRLIGVLVDIGIEFFQLNPQALIKNSVAQKVVTAFVAAITSEPTKIDFDKEARGDNELIGKLQEIAGGVMLAGLQALGKNTNLLFRDERVQALFGGMTKAIVADFKALEAELTEGAKDRRKQFYADITSSLLRGAMAGFADNPTLFFKKNGDVPQVIQDMVTQVCNGLKGQEHLFTPDSLEVILKSSLVAVSADARLITPKNHLLEDLITGTIKAIVEDESGKKIFQNPEGVVAAILKNGLTALGDNIQTLIIPDDPNRLFLVESIKGLTAGLASPLNSGKLQDLLSTQQLISLSQIVFNEVAQNPERLLGKSTATDPKMTALAQIVVSVSKALGDDPKKLITGGGSLTLLQTAIWTAGQNVDKLLDLSDQKPETNLLYKVLQALVNGFSEAQGIQAFKTGEMFVDTACRVIVTASNNLGFVEGIPKDVIPKAITDLITLTAGPDIWSRLNSGNFPKVFDGLLRQVMFGKLNLDNADAVKAAVVKILEAP
jgi:hypothetical protein